MAVLAACAPVSQTPSEIDRFVEAPRDVVLEAFGRAATDRGYRLNSGTYERVLMYRRDPVLGLVKISDDPVLAIVLRPQITAVGETSTRVRLAPQRLQWLWPYADRTLDYWTPGASEYAEAVGVVDAAVAEATASQRQKSTPRSPPR